MLGRHDFETFFLEDYTDGYIGHSLSIINSRELHVGPNRKFKSKLWNFNETQILKAQSENNAFYDSDMATSRKPQKALAIEQQTRKPKRKIDMYASDDDECNEAYSVADSDDYFDEEEMNYDDDEDEDNDDNLNYNGLASTNSLKRKSNEFESYFENLKTSSKPMNFDFIGKHQQLPTAPSVALTSTPAINYDTTYIQYTGDCFLDPNNNHNNPNKNDRYTNDYNSYTVDTKSTLLNIYPSNDISTCTQAEYNQFQNPTQYSNADFFYTNLNTTAMSYCDSIDTASQGFVQTGDGLMANHFYKPTSTPSTTNTASLFNYDPNNDPNMTADQNYFFDQIPNFFIPN